MDERAWYVFAGAAIGIDISIMVWKLAVADWLSATGFALLAVSMVAIVMIKLGQRDTGESNGE